MTILCSLLVSLIYLIGTTTSNATSETVSSNATKSSAANLASADNGNVTEEGDGIPDENWEYENTTVIDTRRILYGKNAGKGKRPYMVYLHLTKESAKAQKYRGWLCGGVIVDKYYVLTSAACVEDADRFYVVSGTNKFVDSFDYKKNECVCKHRRRVVWKCVPKNYKYDFQDSRTWSSNDIAIVKVDKPFKLGVQEKGCEFAPDLICYNNISKELEKPGTKGYIAGWGSGSNFREGVYRRQKAHNPDNAKCLQEAKVCIMDNEKCAKQWSQKYREVITQYMICTKDVMKRLSELCNKKYANCTDVESRRDIIDEGPNEHDTNVVNVDLGRHLRNPDDYTARRSSTQGGFCENDHGGPLIVKYKNKDRVIGVISACKIDPKSHSCHGPFLYTSVFNNRQFISCAIQKDVEEDEGDNCRRVFRTGITHEEWDVNWDDYREDDDDKAADSDADSDDSDDDRQPLRQSEAKNKDDKEKKESSSDESSEDKTKKDKKAAKPKKSKKSKGHSSSKKKEGVEKAEKKSKEDEDAPVKANNKAEVFYESSRDENVNDPEEGE